LIVDSGLTATAGAAARSVQTLAAELRGRGIEVIEAISYDDGLATAPPDPSTDCILLNWTQERPEGGTHTQAIELLRTVRARNAKVPIFLMASRKLAGAGKAP